MQQSGENKLLQKYRVGECTPDEQAMIVHYIMYVDIIPQDLLAMQSNLDELRLSPVRTHIRTRKIIWPAGIVTVVAFIAILLGIGAFILSLENNQPAAYANGLNLDSDKAILMLINGTRINLSDAGNSSLLNQLGIKIRKIEDGTLVYKIASKSNTSGCNTITTPKGGQYKIVLSDGIRVWLKAVSSLSYSTSLKIGCGERKVYIVGDAFFEVRKTRSVIGWRT